jgi:hypothetical protein
MALTRARGAGTRNRNRKWISFSGLRLYEQLEQKRLPERIK